MTSKNLAISGLTATAVIFLVAVFFLGFRIWLSPEGLGLIVAIAVIALFGAAISLRRHDAILSCSENVSRSLPGWVRTWQRIGVLLFMLLLLIFLFFK